jgi:DNA-binding XRE family transcriptional regulator
MVFMFFPAFAFLMVRGYRRQRRVALLDQHKLFIRSLELMSTKNVDLRPSQCRAGRALLEMTQTDLAGLAEVGLSTVVDFEKERRVVSATAVKAIQDALMRAGIDFIDENGGGPGVRLRKRQQKRG